MSAEASITSFVLDLRGEQEVHPLPLVSRAIQAYVLGIISDHDPELAQYLHRGNGAQSFSVSCLRNTRYRTGMLLRIASLNNDLSQMLRVLRPQCVPSLELTGITFKLTNIIYPEDNEQLTGSTSYCELYNDGVARAREGQAELGLRFITPTSFRMARSRLNMPLPWPRLVFQSLANKWNKFSPVAIDVEWAAFDCHVSIARHRLRTQMINFGRYRQVGFLGECWYIVDRQAGEHLLQVVQALAEFAAYSGVGAKTSMGMGQVQRIE
jgi:CRISPR-associated endoribonuclease Cas6